MNDLAGVNEPKKGWSLRAKFLAAVIAILVGLVAGGYFYFKGRRFEHVITEAQIREKLDLRLPFTRTYFRLVDVTLENPRVDLVDGSDRVHAGLDVRLSLRPIGEDKSFGGSVDASAAIKYVPEKGQFFLVEPDVRRLEIDGLPAKYTEKAKLAVSKALEQYYEDHPVYTLNPAQAKQAAAKLLLKSVVTRDEKLFITLGL